jgi:hypothetical protein
LGTVAIAACFFVVGFAIGLAGAVAYDELRIIEREHDAGGE